eukprot:6492602-Amphidinium_carterae.3
MTEVAIALPLPRRTLQGSVPHCAHGLPASDAHTMVTHAMPVQALLRPASPRRQHLKASSLQRALEVRYRLVQRSPPNLLRFFAPCMQRHPVCPTASGPPDLSLQEFLADPAHVDD